MASWKEAAAAKRKAILDSIPARWHVDDLPSSEAQKDVTGKFIHKYLSAAEIEITESDAVDVAYKVRSKQWTAVDVTLAFCHRASIAHQLVNCLHEAFFDAALADAKALDNYLAQHGTTIGPLHGVPVSLKDQFHVKGVETTLGYVGWIGTFQGQKNDPRNRNFESEMVRELRQLGAVLYCKTSVPHTLMTGETVNNIVEYTWNPKNRNLSSGGSSGGEGALIGLRGSCVGFGTDIGGSIRIPAGFNGLYGIRPTSGRLPYEGVANTMDGQTTILSVVGPLATTARGVRLAFQSILSAKPWLHDPTVVDMPWRASEEDAIWNIVESLPREKLAFGLFETDGHVTPQPPVRRAILAVTAALQKAGHEVIEWKPPPHERLVAAAGTAYAYDGANEIHDSLALSGEPMAKQIEVLYGPSRTKVFTAPEIAKNNVEKRAAQKAYGDYWNSTITLTSTGRPVDAVLCPLAPYATVRPNGFKYYAYSIWVNGLDYTSAVVPVTTADKSIDQYPAGYRAMNEDDEGVFNDYDAEIYDGAHVSIQVVGRRHTEEKMLAIAEYVGSLVGK